MGRKRSRQPGRVQAPPPPPGMALYDLGPWPVDDPGLIAATSFRKLLAAHQAARRGKPKTAAMDRFDLQRETALLALQRSLRDGSWQPGPYRQFEVRDPRPRLVSAAPFADRVVHHALMAAAGPTLDAALGPEVYANRTAPHRRPRRHLL